MTSARVCQPQTEAQREVEDEVEVLKSIYPGDVQDLRSLEAWTHWRPPKLALKLRPLHQSRSGADDAKTQGGFGVTLTVRCSARYPKDPPELALSEATGLDEAKIRELQRKLDDEAKSLVGQVMIYQLVQLVETYLYEQSKPPGPTQAELAAQQLAAQQAEAEDRARRAIEAEIRKRRSANTANTPPQSTSSIAVARQRSESGARGGVGGSPDEGKRPSGSTKSSTTKRRKSVCGAGGSESGISQRLSQMLGSSISFPSSLGGAFPGGEFRILRCLGGCQAAANEAGSLSAVYLALSSSDSSLYAVSEFYRPDNRDKTSSAKSLETELLSLTRLAHPNLVRVASVLVAQNRALLLADHILGQSLHVPLSNGIAQPLSQLRLYLGQILAALEYLHSKDILHRSLRPSSLFVTGDGQVKLADYLADWKLREVFGLPQVARPLIIGRGSKRTDIYALGVLVLELHLGRYLEKGSDVSLPPDLPPALRDFLDRCLDRLEQQRWTAQQLGRHPLLLPAAKQHPQQQQQQFVGDVGLLDAEAAVADANAAAVAAAAAAAADADAGAFPGRSAAAAALGGRLRNDFEIVSFLGKGGYGDVVKARNKLDGRLYAVKRVRLKNQRQEVIRKILREVRLLSRLNHEHVVRYYYSWLEDEIVESSGDKDASSAPEVKTASSQNRLEAVVASDSPSFASPTKQERNRLRKQQQQQQQKQKKSNNKNNEQSLEDLVGLAPQSSNCYTFEASGLGSTFGEDANSATDSSSSSEGNAIGRFFGQHSNAVYGLSTDDEDDEDDDEDEHSDDDDDDEDSDNDDDEDEDQDRNDADSNDDEDCDVVFQRSSAAQSSAAVAAAAAAAAAAAGAPSAAAAVDEAEGENSGRMTSLYIQMEFCERSTLRLAIDNGLPNDKRRSWRFFKELLEGLDHIHRSDIIHRDLKPSNVFIDATDHIKIGDFGLATTTTVEAASAAEDAAAAAVLSAEPPAAGGAGAGSMTGQIGTFFYLAPELLVANKVSAYTAKVDMYSLGVIFFEMTRPDVGTEMERRMLLTDLRQPEIRLPSDYNNPSKVSVLQALLCHDPDSRPTARQMLESSQLPAYIFETTQFENLVRSAVDMPESRNYKFLLSCLFNRKVTLPEDHAFDVDMCKPVASELLNARRWTRATFERVFARHGAIYQQTPLVMPRLDAFDDLLRPHTVYYLGRDGDVLGLPCDLRVPFARYAARAGIQSARRYAIDRVVRERTVDTHPREMTDCAFDIVCDANAAQDAEAELLHLVHEVVDEFRLDSQQQQQQSQQQPRRQQQRPRRQHAQSNQLRPTLIVNHASLLKGALLYCGVPESLHSAVCSRLQAPPASTAAGQAAVELTERLVGLEFDGSTMQHLAGLFVEEADAAALLQAGYYRRLFGGANRETAALIKHGLSAIDQTRLLYEKFGFNRSLPMRARPLFVGGVGEFAVYSSGIFFQLMAMIPPSKIGANWRLDILASGGRYDDLLLRFARPKGAAAAAAAAAGTGNPAAPSTPASAVGVSFAFDRLAQIIRRRASPLPLLSPSPLERPAVLVAPLGPLGMRESACRLLHLLWLRGLNALVTSASEELLDGTDELRRLFREHRAACVVLAPEASNSVASATFGAASGILDRSNSSSRCFRIRRLAYPHQHHNHHHQQQQQQQQQQRSSAAAGSLRVSDLPVRSLDEVVRHLYDGFSAASAASGDSVGVEQGKSSGEGLGGVGGSGGGGAASSADALTSGGSQAPGATSGDDPATADSGQSDPNVQQAVSSIEDAEASIVVTLLLGERYQHHQRRKAESQTRARLAAVAAAATGGVGGFQLRAVVTELTDSSHRQLVACLRPSGTEEDWQAGWKEALGDQRREAAGQRKLLDKLRRWLTDFRAKRRSGVALVFLFGLGDEGSSGGSGSVCPPLVFLPS